MTRAKLLDRIAKLREMTVERGCTPAEAANAQAEADRQEAKLGSARPSRRRGKIGRAVTIYHGDEVMYANECGWIERPGLFRPSPDWCILCAIELDEVYGDEVRRWELADVLDYADEIPWQWPDGSQRVHIVDYDHGSHRVWMSPPHRLTSARRRRAPKKLRSHS